MFFNPRTRLRDYSVLVAAVVAVAAPVVAETANFGTLTLSRGFQPPTGVLNGSTGGSFSLSAIANTDFNKNKCLGYATPTPDHLLVLEQSFSQLTITVNSGGKDTTLLVQGPGRGKVLCGDDVNSNKDARVTDSEWKPGTYRIWVGTMEAGAKYKYTLSVQE